MTTLQGGGGGRSSKNAWLQRNKNAMRSASSGAAEKYDAIFVVVFLWGKLKTCTPMSLAPTTERIIIFECNWNYSEEERKKNEKRKGSKMADVGVRFFSLLSVVFDCRSFLSFSFSFLFSVFLFLWHSPSFPCYYSFLLARPFAALATGIRDQWVGRAWRD